MIDSFLGALSPLLMLFLCMLSGYLLNKLKLMPEATATVLSKCEKYLFMPALGYATFSQYCTVETISENTNIVIYSMIAITIAIIIAMPLSKAFEKHDLNQRNIYKYALVFANHGFMGNAIVPLVLGGQEHLYKYLLFTLPLNFLTYIWGINILTPKELRSGSLLKNLLNAPMVGMVLGMVVGLTGTQKFMPGFVITTVESLQNCMGPVAMILTGFVIGNYSFKSLISQKKVYIVTALRLVVLPIVILTILLLCGANKYIMTLSLFAYATPLGLNTVVFPAIYGGDTQTGASMAMISHVFCVITIPVMYGLLKLL
ncbi:MAG: hypothetical protein E7403_03470 [Ruminococcaceae bacterium]|nr:hypothetical protein [Oscillospiraceae bacterium]